MSKQTMMHFVIRRYDQPDRPAWVVSYPLREAKSGEASVFTDQMVHIVLETRSRRYAEQVCREHARDTANV